MSNPCRRIPTTVSLTIGLALGWVLFSQRPPAVKAGGSDRYGDYILTSGPIALQYNERTKTQAPQDALYFLDYRAAKLLATVPILRASTSGAQIIDTMIERDLIADFKIDVDRGVNPHFLMTPGSLGAYGEGWAPLFVFETTTKQVAVYKFQLPTVSSKVSSKFELIEIKSFGGPPAPQGQAN